MRRGVGGKEGENGGFVGTCVLGARSLTFWWLVAWGFCVFVDWECASFYLFPLVCFVCVFVFVVGGLLLVLRYLLTYIMEGRRVNAGGYL